MTPEIKLIASVIIESKHYMPEQDVRCVMGLFIARFLKVNPSFDLYEFASACWGENNSSASALHWGNAKPPIDGI